MRRFLLSLLLGSAAASAQVPHLGVTRLPASPVSGPLTLFYPTTAAERAERIGSLPLSLAREAAPAPGNGRLVVLSHGSGGGPWVHSALARTLVETGFIVAVPEHAGDHHGDTRLRGPDSWKRRPTELSRAIDRLAAEPAWGPSLQLDQVGIWGMSAGGHTALSMAGGRWSPARFRAHCRAHLAEDFQTCVGLASELTGGVLDGLKQSIAQAVLGWRFGGDDTVQQHHDPRVAAVVAGVPAAADFDPDSLARPAVPLAFITARQDLWLIPRFHAERILAACLPRCERLADLPQGGHGALLNPLPTGFDRLEGKMLNDPPGFDRGALHALDQKVAAYFARHLGVTQFTPAVTTP